MKVGRRVWVQGDYGLLCDMNYGEKLMFRERNDYCQFLYLVETCKLLYNFKVYGYCLLPSYYYLLIEVGDELICEAIEWINTQYSKFYNNKYDIKTADCVRVYDAIPVFDEIGLISISRIIHKSPVNEKITTRPEDYEWSSYNTYISNVNDGVTYQNHIMKFFQNDSKYYKEYVMNMIEEHMPCNTYYR